MDPMLTLEQSRGKKTKLNAVHELTELFYRRLGFKRYQLKYSDAVFPIIQLSE